MKFIILFGHLLLVLSSDPCSPAFLLTSSKHTLNLDLSNHRHFPSSELLSFPAEKSHNSARWGRFIVPISVGSSKLLVNPFTQMTLSLIALTYAMV